MQYKFRKYGLSGKFNLFLNKSGAKWFKVGNNL